MRITDIKIKNYRAFYGEHHINLESEGKNLMVYGENGSGKSSLYTALQCFFKSSVSKVEVEENIFIPTSQKNTAAIKVKVKENEGSTINHEFEVNSITKEIVGTEKVLIANANKIKGFFDYRSLLRTHLQHKNQVDLFNILIEDILYNSINRFTNKEIGKEWSTIRKDTDEKKQTSRLKEATKTYLQDKFNPALKELLQSIERDTNTFIDYFETNLKITLTFDKVEYGGRRRLFGNTINLNLEFLNKPIPNHHLFLNEARLSALAISLYLASIRVNPLSGTLKVLVLDDLLIGLDMSNRLPLLKILKTHFIDIEENQRFQIIMTTYDKVWFELVKSHFGHTQWKYIEIYSKKLKDEDFEIPIIKNTDGYIDRAKHYLVEKDYKASAVYLRTEFERIIKVICYKKELLVPFKTNQKDFDTNDFWDAITKQTNIERSLVEQVEIHRSLVMNPFSHYDLEKPEFERELTDTIAAIEELKKITKSEFLNNRLRKTTIDDFKNKIAELESKVTEKQEIIERIRNNRNNP